MHSSPLHRNLCWRQQMQDMTLLDPLHHSQLCVHVSARSYWAKSGSLTALGSSILTGTHGAASFPTSHSGNGEWEPFFDLKISDPFCQQTGWTLRKSLKIVSIHLRLLGCHAYKTLFCRQQSSAQAELILCHLRHAHQTGFLKGSSGEGWPEETVIQIQMNASTCGKDLTAFEEKKYFLPTQISSSCQIVASFENYSVQIGNIATLPSCEVLFFTKKKKHLKLCELI